MTIQILSKKIVMVNNRLKISLILRTSRVWLKIRIWKKSRVKSRVSFDYIWNFRLSNLYSSPDLNTYLKFHSQWDDAGLLWETGRYYEAVALRKDILHEVYEIAKVDYEGYAPPLMEEWWTTRIGHLAVLGVFSLAQDLEIVPPKKRTLILSEEVGNHELREALKKEFVSVASKGKPSWTQLSQFWPLCEKMQLIRTKNDFIDQYELWETVFQKLNEDREVESSGKGYLTLPDDYIEACTERLNSNINSFEDNFVVVHIRGSRFWEDRRSQTVSNYEKSIEYLIKEGYSVIRIGDSEMTPLTQRKGFLDLTRMGDGGRDLHAFLLACCKFMIGTTSGPSWIPPLFDKPVLMTNATSLGKIMLTTNKNSKYLPKQFKSKEEKWSLSRILTSRHAFSESSKRELKSEGIDLIENTEDEILAATKEMVAQDRQNKITNTYPIHSMVRTIQDEFKSVGKGRFADSYLVENADWLLKT